MIHCTPLSLFKPSLACPVPHPYASRGSAYILEGKDRPFPTVKVVLHFLRTARRVLRTHRPIPFLGFYQMDNRHPFVGRLEVLPGIIRQRPSFWNSGEWCSSLPQTHTAPPPPPRTASAKGLAPAALAIGFADAYMPTNVHRLRHGYHPLFHGSHTYGDHRTQPTRRRPVSVCVPLPGHDGAS